jgi:hypothetical protein
LSGAGEGEESVADAKNMIGVVIGTTQEIPS